MKEVKIGQPIRFSEFKGFRLLYYDNPNAVVVGGGEVISKRLRSHLIVYYRGRIMKGCMILKHQINNDKRPKV